MYVKGFLNQHEICQCINENSLLRRVGFCLRIPGIGAAHFTVMRLPHTQLTLRNSYDHGA